MVIVVQPVVLPALIFALVLAFITDIHSHKIPNWLTYPIIFLAIFSYSAVKGLQGLVFSAEGLGLGLAVLMPFYMLGAMGAGDVKLMAAVGAALGPGHLFYAFLCTAITGGVYAAIVLLSHAGGLKELASRFYGVFRAFVPIKGPDLARPGGGVLGLQIYYGAAICIGTLGYIFFEVYRGDISSRFF